MACTLGRCQHDRCAGRLDGHDGKSGMKLRRPLSPLAMMALPWLSRAPVWADVLPAARILARALRHLCSLRFIAALVFVLTARVALADCVIVTGNETAGCTLPAAGQTIRIQGGATLNGYINMTGAGTALTVDSGGTFQFLAGQPGQPSGSAVTVGGTNGSVTNNGTLLNPTNTATDVLVLSGNGFNVVNRATGLIVNNSTNTFANAVTNFTAGVSGTLTNSGTIRATGGASEGTIYMPGSGGVFTLDNRAGATIQGLNSIA